MRLKFCPPHVSRPCQKAVYNKSKSTHTFFLGHLPTRSKTPRKPPSRQRCAWLTWAQQAPASVTVWRRCQCPSAANLANGGTSARLIFFLNVLLILLRAANQTAVLHLCYLPGHWVPLARANSETGSVKENAAARSPLPAHALVHAMPLLSLHWLLKSFHLKLWPLLSRGSAIPSLYPDSARAGLVQPPELL